MKKDAVAPQARDAKTMLKLVQQPTSAPFKHVQAARLHGVKDHCVVRTIIRNDRNLLFEIELPITKPEGERLGYLSASREARLVPAGLPPIRRTARPRSTPLLSEDRVG